MEKKRKLTRKMKRVWGVITTIVLALGKDYLENAINTFI